ncbi:phosphate regulon transcriptional regulator PhoB [Polynucleobacter sp. IMCC30063]|uniref:phosphate regulon transcriptional regulator PhoB n=1 Tax=unclassified Polynucleobacter TaxID=2640945 RepID=UPI001F170BB4|nr:MULTISPECIES: phosphate regulon transcriptional regulator PhoB [unclassified Polynucleobacter]MCE7505861.1 phosphate regulon transcriptional regulator PhoB [Polynucleobacter sp. IMCC30063]MCE7527054.1 phosphate regulon transcriptional regulator PhoB [Polynucleobacter sp. IMCC 30228]MCE7529315.1 phosphate regulon transcriptional regulator PhoB [Polynucleobacter sp. IMCC 29146]
MGIKILIIEDEPAIAELIAINLVHAGYEVERAFQADQAVLMMKEAMPDLLVLDWMLPGKSGVQFAKELRSNPKTIALPILMLTAKSEEADKVLGLDAGADDYVTKPFSPKELIARVKAILRRQLPSTDEVPLTVGPLKLDPVAHRLMATSPHSEPQAIALGPTEFRLLQFLMSNPERVHSRSVLLDRVWGNEVYIEERTVDVHIKRLRAALAFTECDHFIETVRGSGYRVTKNPIQN